MAQGHDDNGGEKGQLIDRRSYMKLAGAAGALATIGAGVTAASTNADADTVVDLGERGLSEGDVIDPYLDEYFRSGVEVRIPEGEYDWHGGGFSYYDDGDAAVVGEGEVILQTVAGEFNNRIHAASGTIELRNLTVRGAVAGESRMRLETASSGRILVINVNFPDGAVDDAARTKAFYVPVNHAGLIGFKNCYIRNCSDNGIYASSQGRGDGGRIVIDSCVAHNNNITGFRIGGVNSVIRNSVVINDGRAPEPTGYGRNQRGIRIDNSEQSQDMRIENCDVIHSSSYAGEPIEWSSRAAGSTGHIEGVRIRNNNDIAAIAARRSHAEGWTGNDIHVSGDGSHDVPSWFENVYTGDDAAAPSTSTADDAVGSPEQPVFEVWATDEGERLDYVVEGEGSVEFYDDPFDDRLRGGGNDYITEHDDGTFTIEGHTGNQHGDAFLIDGEVTSFEKTGYDSDFRLVYDGQEVSPEDLGSDDDNPDDDGDDVDNDNPDDDGDDVDNDNPDDGAEEELTNLLIVDGTPTDDVTKYFFEVTGQVERDDAISSVPEDSLWWDDMEDRIDEDSVTGIVGKGVDGYRYSGELVRFEFDGAARLTVESSDL